MAAALDLTSLEKDPRLFLYTSLTAGSSHIITATSRMETILKANKIPFQAIDTATDEKARRLWQRRAGQRKLPGLVKEGWVIGDLNEVEEWNEFGELKENIGPVPANNAAPAGGQVGVNIAPPLSIKPQGTTNIPRAINVAPKPLFDKSKAIPLPGAEEIAARNKKPSASTSTLEAANPETLTSVPNEKKESIEQAKEAAEEKGTKEEKAVTKEHPAIDHLSAPASRIHSGSATPAPAQQEEAPLTPVPTATMSTTAKSPDGDVVEALSEAIQGKEDEKPEEAALSGVAGLKVKDEEVVPQKQDAADPESAGKSNED